MLIFDDMVVLSLISQNDTYVSELSLILRIWTYEHISANIVSCPYNYIISNNMDTEAPFFRISANILDVRPS